MILFVAWKGFKCHPKYVHQPLIKSLVACELSVLKQGPISLPAELGMTAQCQKPRSSSDDMRWFYCKVWTWTISIE